MVELTPVEPTAPRGCRGCGWNIRNDLARGPGEIRSHYCTVCDPSGTREANVELHYEAAARAREAVSK